MPAKAKKRCPECGATVRIDKLEDHMKKVHPNVDRHAVLTEEEKSGIERKKRSIDRRPISKKEASLYAIGLVVILVVVLVIVFYKPQNILQPGEPAPDFIVKDTNDATFHLASKQPSVILLNLMDAKCSHCQIETKNVLVNLYSKYSGRVVFVSIDVQILGPDTVATLKAFMAANGATWTYCLDTDNVKGKYKVEATPTTYIIDRDMKVFYHNSGTTTLETLTAKLDAALG